MADEKERVNWSALMDAHGIDPDADTASPAVEPDRAGQPSGRRSRLVHGVIAVTALFSIAASAAVLIALLRGRGERDEASSATAALRTAPGNRPAAFQQTSDGVTVVPPEASAPAAEPPQEAPPAAATPEPPAEKPAPPPPEREPEPKAKGGATGAKRSSGEKAAAPPADKAAPAPPAEKAAQPSPADKAAQPPPAEKAAQPPPAGPADSNLPDEPTKDAVASAMGTLEKDIFACAAPAKVSGEVGIKMRIEPDGRVAWASAKVQNSPFQACLDRLFKKARMPRSVKGATVRQTVQLP